MTELVRGVHCGLLSSKDLDLGFQNTFLSDTALNGNTEVGASLGNCKWLRVGGRWWVWGAAGVRQRAWQGSDWKGP